MYNLLALVAVLFLYGTLIFGPFIAFGILARPKNETLTGIQGWLAWLALGQVWGLAGLAWLTCTSLTNYRAVSAIMPDGPDVAVSYEMVLSNGVYLGTQMIVTYALFAKKRYFRKLFVLDWLFLLALTGIDVGYAVYVTDTHLFDGLTAEDVMSTVGVVALSAIPVAYVLRSRRVANTMIR